MSVPPDDVVPPPPPHDEAPASIVPSAEERQWAMFGHLSALLGLVTAGWACFLGPLVIWLVKKDTMPFVNDQGKEALNFQITATLVLIGLVTLGTILLVVLVGFLFYIAAFIAGIAWLVLTILAAIRANNGEYYRYPWTWRPVK